MEETRAVGRSRTERYGARLPTVTSTVPGLAAYYRRSIASGLVREAPRLFDESETRYPRRGELLDHGEQANLLEMRGRGWEHVVASPNAERAWCLERPAELGECSGAASGDGVRSQGQKAERMRRAIRHELWDADAHWFKALHPEGPAEYVHTIQAFDALRAGACDAAMERALLERVVDGAFLGT